MVVAVWTGCVSFVWRPGHLTAEWSLPLCNDGKTGLTLERIGRMVVAFSKTGRAEWSLPLALDGQNGRCLS